MARAALPSARTYRRRLSRIAGRRGALYPLTGEGLGERDRSAPIGAFAGENIRDGGETFAVRLRADPTEGLS